MNLLIKIEQMIVPGLPLYFLVRYLTATWRAKKWAESYWLIASNAVFWLLLSLTAFTVIFGVDWPARTPVRLAVFTITTLLFIGEVIWLEYRLRGRVSNRSTIGAQPTEHEESHRESDQLSEG